MTVTRKVRIQRRERGRRVIMSAAPTSEPPAAVPRVARLMALAIQFDLMVRSRQVADQSELARLARVTQPRMTQIMNLALLAPDIQEALLSLPPVERGRAAFCERDLRPLAAEPDWRLQRAFWRELLSQRGLLR